jgi:hypothetical protein
MKVTLPQKPDYQEMIRLAAQAVGSLTVLEALFRSIQTETISLDVAAEKTKEGEESMRANFLFPYFDASKHEIARGLTEALRNVTNALMALSSLPVSFSHELERLKRFAKENGHEIA